MDFGVGVLHESPIPAPWRSGVAREAHGCRDSLITSLTIITIPSYHHHNPGLWLSIHHSSAAA